MWWRPRTLVPPLAATVYVAFLIWQAPHTVHHFFEHDTDKPNECALSASAERSAGTTVPSISLTPVSGFDLPLVPVVPDVPARPADSVLGPRAPPAATA